MKRLLNIILMACVAVAVATSGAEAAGKKKKRGKRGKKTPVSAEISKSMGAVKWGMNKKQVMKYFITRVKDEYRPLVAKTHDAVEEDRLRQEASEKIKAIRDGYVEFNGRSTGWDVSFLKGEFTHNNGESMLVVRDDNSQNFYFFIDGKLWKWYKAFDANVFPSGNFKRFAGAVTRKFGDAKPAEGEPAPGVGKRRWLEWQDKQTRLRAVDQSSFYGFYCLVFEEKNTVKRLASLRTNVRDSGPKTHALVDSVTSGDSVESDESPNIVDRITGKLRVNESSRSTKSSSSSSKSRGSESSSSSSSSSTQGVSADDDPLRGLGL